jgi:hypothetical protein
MTVKARHFPKILTLHAYVILHCSKVICNQGAIGEKQVLLVGWFTPRSTSLKYSEQMTIFCVKKWYD